MDSEPSRWRRLFSRNRVKMNLFHMVAIICLQSLCYSVVSSIDTYISSLPSSTNSSKLYDPSGNQNNNETCPRIDNDTSDSESDPTAIYERNIANSVPAVIMTYLLGILMPFIGKRFVLLSCMMGIGIQMIIALAILYLSLSIYWWYFSAFVLGLFGGTGIIDLVTYLIIVDITTKDNRSLWFVRFYALKKGLEAVATFFIFWFVEYHGYGYIALFWCGFILQLIAIIVIWLYYDLSLYNHTNLSGYYQVDDLNFDIVTIFRGNRRSRIQIITVLLTLIAYCFYTLIHSMSSTFFLALENYPICWSDMLINIYKLVKDTSIAVFSIIGYHLFAWITKSNDILICAMGHGFFLISSIWVAFSRYKWQVFTSSAFYTLANYQNPLTFSILAAWLKPHEINIAFIFIIVFNQLIISFGDLIFKWIYMNTSNQHKNIVLFVAAGLCIIPLVLNIYMYIVKRRMLQQSAGTIDERTSLLGDTNENQNSSQSADDDDDDDNSPTTVTLFSIGNLALIVNVRSRSQHNPETTSDVETNQNSINT